jgi:protein ImuA
MRGKADILSQLKEELLPLQGYKHKAGNEDIAIELGPINQAFPHHQFPIGAIHECIYDDIEQLSVSAAFITYILSSLMKQGAVSIWISQTPNIFPPALHLFNIDPAKLIFIKARKGKECLWCMEEALKCEGIASVIGEIDDVDLTASRRLQLAVEESRVTGFVLRNKKINLSNIASVAKWKISSLLSSNEDCPGVGFPQWNIELLKVRNGQPGTWKVECRNNKINTIESKELSFTIQQKIAG